MCCAKASGRGDDAIRPAFPATHAELAVRLADLIGLRRRYPWLHRARSRVTELRNRNLVFEAVDGEKRLWVACNLGDTSIARSIPALVDWLAGDLAVHRKGVTTEIVLPAYGWGILVDAAG